MSASDDFAAKTSLAVSSIEFCQALFDEGDIGMREGSGGMGVHMSQLQNSGHLAKYVNYLVIFLSSWVN